MLLKIRVHQLTTYVTRYVSNALSPPGNSGRPAGACATKIEVVPTKIHPGHRTQEEDMVSNWFVTEGGQDVGLWNKLFSETISEVWGMVEVESEAPDTIQGVDYVNATIAEDYADAWLVPDVQLSPKAIKAKSQQDESGDQSGDEPNVELIFDTEHKFPCALVFVGGPNAGASNRSEGSMARTLNKRSVHDYDFFKDCVKVALREGFDVMIQEGFKVAIVARISCGIYAGVHKERINEEFVAIVDSILEEPITTCLEANTSMARGRYFKEVIVAMLASPQVITLFSALLYSGTICYTIDTGGGSSLMLSCAAAITSCRTRTLSCRTPTVSCRTRMLSCRTAMLSCRTGMLSCRTGMVSCRTRMMSCRTGMLSCRTGMVSCRTRIVSCRTGMLSCRTGTLSCRTETLSCRTAMFFHDFSWIIRASCARGAEGGRGGGRGDSESGECDVDGDGDGYGHEGRGDIRTRPSRRYLFTSTS